MAHRFRSFITTAFVIALATLALGGPAEAADAPRPSQTGRWLLDPDGRVMVLHGVNMVNKTGTHEPGATGFSADDAAFLAEQRLHDGATGADLEGGRAEPGEYDDAYLESVRETTELLAAEGIWTLLDFHQDLYSERFQGEGAPDWAVQDDGLPAEPAARLPVQLLRHARALASLRPLLEERPGPRRRRPAGPLRGGVGARRRVLQRDARRDGLRPVQRAVARHRVRHSASTRAAAPASTRS